MFSKGVKKTPAQVFGCGLSGAEVGIEIELEGSGFDNCPSWSIHNEGSVQGVEYVTKPVKIDKVADLVKKLDDKLKAVQALVHHNHRTSTHIHVNVSQDTFSTILGFMTIFVMFEPLLMRLCGNQRDGNLFCLSSYDTGDLPTFMSMMCRSIDRMENFGLDFHRGKYSSLNVLRLRDLGTLECRCFPSSLDGQQITQWCRWLEKMLKMARDNNDPSLRSLWKAVRANPSYYAIEVFGTAAFNVPNTSELIDFGTENAYELTRVLKHWYSKPEKEEKPKDKIKVGKSSFSTAEFMNYANIVNTGTMTWANPSPSIPVNGIVDDTEF